MIPLPAGDLGTLESESRGANRRLSAEDDQLPVACADSPGEVSPGLRAEHPGSAYRARSARPRDGRLSDKKTRVESYLRGAPVPALDRERLSRLDVVEHDPGEFPSSTHVMKPRKVTKDFCKQRAPKWPLFPGPLYTSSRSSFFPPLSQANPIPLVHGGY